MTQTAYEKTISCHWRIVWMELWDQEYVDMLETGYVKISRDGRGEFMFGVVSGSFHVDPDHAHFDSVWEGSQECDEARGDIYGTLDEEGKEGDLCGTLSFWEGDESEYRAVRVTHSPPNET